MRISLIIQIAVISTSIIFNYAYSQSELINKDLTAFDTIFRNAVNSPGYVVARKDQINDLKNYLEKERSEQIKSLELKQKELTRLQTSMDSVIKIVTVEKPEPVLSKSNISSTVLIVIVFVLLLLLTALFLKGFNEKKELKEGRDSYQNLVAEFDLHKKNAIERERKLMRKVIDLQNQLDFKSSSEN